MWGTTRGYLDNAVKGVTQGFRKQLELHGVGFKAAVEQREYHGKTMGHFFSSNTGEKHTLLVMRIGFSHDVIVSRARAGAAPPSPSPTAAAPPAPPPPPAAPTAPPPRSFGRCPPPRTSE